MPQSLWRGSCSKEEGSKTSYELTEADKVVASAEFQAYYKELMNHSKKIATAFSKLSDEDRQKFVELREAFDNDPSLDFLTEASAILGIDLKSGYAKVEEYRSSVRNPHAYTRDVSISMARYSKLNTRNGDKLTPEEQANADKLSGCLAGCAISYNTASAICDSMQARGEFPDPESYIMCSVVATGIQLECIRECNKLFGGK